MHKKAQNKQSGIKEPQYVDTVSKLDKQANCALKNKNHTRGKHLMKI